MSAVKGLADLNRRASLLSRDIATKIGQSANRAGTKEIADAIRTEATDGPTPEGEVRNRRRKSGKTVQEPHKKIKNHIRVVKVRAKDGVVENAVVIDAYHAGMEEFGSIHNTPNPFAKRGFDKARNDAIEKVKKVLERRIAKEEAKL
ncbi:HK97-gp10 family putative phage morphogenesis protein [uncultured Sphingomonas sp.]|uniref:HK97-gp10 family putative phage morphogenesis protein n=1 Tax=uncultured Sphingomonas sp. TaxID=158754 RepID=UPI0025D53E84|nr:HK97-gp10 family putative phage morphogenesis protein [uncultured Sphingomonas sp.]